MTKQTSQNHTLTEHTAMPSYFYVALISVLIMAGYQVGLCYVHTHYMSVSNAWLGAVEALVLGVVAFKISPKCGLREVVTILGLLIYFMILWFLRADVNLFALRNLMIIFCFLYLGRGLSLAQANKILLSLSSVVLLFAGWEYFFVESYGDVLNVLEYSVHRGVTSKAALLDAQNNLFVSSVRLGDRNLFSFLGNHRISSIFLEPVSMGNFAAILSMWALSFDWKEWRISKWFFLFAALFVAASDSRFASVIFFVFLGVRFFPLFQKKAVILLMPLVSVCSLIIFTLMGQGNSKTDTAYGRLMRSGETLLDSSVSSIMGLVEPVRLGDMGVTYSFQHFGVFLAIILWVLFVQQKTVLKQAQRFHAMMAVYIVSLLLISGTSLYSAKTAAILWLLFGVLQFAGAEGKNLDITANCGKRTGSGG